MSHPDYPSIARQAIAESTRRKTDALEKLDDFSDPDRRRELESIHPEKVLVPVKLGEWKEYLAATRERAKCVRTHRDLMLGVRRLAGSGDETEINVQACCILNCQPDGKPSPAPAKSDK